MKKVIFIDWNKTLSYNLFWEHLQNLGHPNHELLARIEKWLFVDNRDTINLWMRGDLSTEDIIIRMSRETGIDSKLIIDELRTSCETMRFCIDNLEDSIAAIRKQGVKVVVATDNMDTFSRYTVPAMNLTELFDDILNSHEIGHLKDDELPLDSIPFFDNYLKANGWKYTDCVLLDDSPDKSGKYKQFGFERILIDSPNALKAALERFTHAV